MACFLPGRAKDLSAPIHMYTSYNTAKTHPEVVEGGQCDSLPGDVL